MVKGSCYLEKCYGNIHCDLAPLKPESTQKAGTVRQYFFLSPSPMEHSTGLGTQEGVSQLGLKRPMDNAMFYVRAS